MMNESLIYRLKLSYKMALVGLTLGMPVIILAYLLVSNVNDQAKFVKQELRGVTYLNKLLPLYYDISQHQIYNTAVNSGEAGLRESLTTAETKIEQQLEGLAAAEKEVGSDLQTLAEFETLMNRWREVKAAGLSASNIAYRNLLNATQALSSRIGDTSNLIYDPVNVSYALQDNVVYRIPYALESLTELRVAALSTTIKKNLSAELRDQIVQARGRLDFALEQVQANQYLIVQYSPEAKAKLQPAFESFIQSIDKVKEVIDQQFLRSTNNLPILSTFLNSTNPVLSALAAEQGYQNLIMPVLQNLLESRGQKYSSTMYTAILAIVLGTAITVVLVVYLVRIINGQLTSLLLTFDEIQAGNYKARAEVRTKDELGTLAESLNTMLDNTVSLIQSKDERDAIQTSIMKLLEDVSGVAEGDLTKHADVTEDVTGAIADSFNYMIDQLRKVIYDVQKATLQVTRSSADIFGAAQSLAKGAENQAVQIVSTSGSVEEMARSIRQVSENAESSASVAQQAIQSAQAGNDAVRSTIQGMNRIRDQVQETAKRIKRLGESSQEIGQIIQLIEDIADRTSILALNASIQAAMAGDAGRGFAVVAEEVERLADRSTDATKKIATLVRSIQSETNEAVNAMEKGIQEVVEGSRLATSAGQALAEIETVSNRLAELIHNITKASRQQAKASESVVKTMNDISQVTQRSAEGTRNAAVSVNQLAVLADRLRASVASFRLPGGTNSYDLDAMPSLLDTNAIEGKKLPTNSDFIDMNLPGMTTKSNDEIVLGRF